MPSSLFLRFALFFKRLIATRKACLTIKTGLLGFCLLTAHVGAWCQSTANFPTKPIRIIVPFPPGGSVDVVTRLIAPNFADTIGQSVIIDNRGGASGNIGAEMVAHAPTDGYTLLAHTIPFVANNFLYSRMPYHPIKDFSPVSLLSSAPVLLVVHPSIPARTLPQLLALARAKPGTLNYSSAGSGTNHHIAGELLNYLAKINLTVVQYKGGGPATIAALAGEVDITWPNMIAALPFTSSGRLRALAVTGTHRVPAIADIPTMNEAGVPGYELTTWHGILAPLNTPTAIVNKLNDALVKAVRLPSLSERFTKEGADIIASTPSQFAQHLNAEFERWGQVIKERKMRAE